MILPDVNVLVYAFRDDAQNHRLYRSWVESVVNGGAAYAISPQVLSSVVRITTNRRVFSKPSQIHQVLAYCRVLMDQQHCQLVRPEADHWRIFSDLCGRTNAAGNLVQDAWFAALAIEHGCEWITADRDYARFPGLAWRPPF